MNISLEEQQNKLLFLKKELEEINQKIINYKLEQELNRALNTNYNIHPNASTALTVWQKPGLLTVINTTKEATKFSLKSLLISLAITILNLFL